MRPYIFLRHLLAHLFLATRPPSSVGWLIQLADFFLGIEKLLVDYFLAFFFLAIFFIKRIQTDFILNTRQKDDLAPHTGVKSPNGCLQSNKSLPPTGPLNLETK